MGITEKHAHKAPQGLRWCLCRRCFRPYNRAEDHTTGCPRCYPTMRTVRGLDAETTKPTVVSRLSALGAPTGDGSEVRQVVCLPRHEHERRGGGVAGRGRADE